MRSPAYGRISYRYHLWHRALDITNKYRTQIVAPESGTVSYVGQMGSGFADAGLVVQIGNTNNGHRLCHLDSYIVKVGQKVKEGQVVGYMGYTGFTIPAGINGTHLHWIMFRNGGRVDPSRYVTVYSAPPKTPSLKMPKVGSKIRLAKGTKRTTWVAGTTRKAGTINVRDNTYVYLVRGYDPVYKGRILINSFSGGGNGVALALYYTNGKNIGDWKQL